MVDLVSRSESSAAAGDGEAVGRRSAVALAAAAGLDAGTVTALPNAPGAPIAAAGPTDDDIDRFLDALAQIASGEPSPVPYEQDPQTGDFHPRSAASAWWSASRRLGASCARG